jgi:hypothetical protein
MARKKWWKGIKIPNPVTFTTGEQAPAYRMIDDFFRKVREKIEETYPNWPHVFKIKLYHCFTDGLVGQTGGVPQAYLKALFCGDRIVCSVTVTSTDLNNDHFSFALYEPEFPWTSMYHEYLKEEKIDE